MREYRGKERWGDGGEGNCVSGNRGGLLFLLGYGGDGAMELIEHTSRRSRFTDQYRENHQICHT